MPLSASARRALRAFGDRLEDLSPQARRMYIVGSTLMLLTALVCLLAPWLQPKCDDDTHPVILSFGNPMFDPNRCLRSRAWSLLGLTPVEADFGRRLMVATLFGALIGMERRSSSMKGVGVRVNACVSLGACCFTLCSMFAFETGALEFDASRSTAAIPTGVTFLASATIWKGISVVNGATTQKLRGLVTAASLWVSASVGAAAGGQLYATALIATLLLLMLNRLSPRIQKPKTT